MFYGVDYKKIRRICHNLSSFLHRDQQVSRMLHSIWGRFVRMEPGEELVAVAVVHKAVAAVHRGVVRRAAVGAAHKAVAARRGEVAVDTDSNMRFAVAVGFWEMKRRLLSGLLYPENQTTYTTLADLCFWRWRRRSV